MADAKKAADKAVSYDRRYLDNPKNPRRRASDADVVAAVAPQAYPAWRYHATLGHCIVPDAAADAGLGEGWSATPPEHVAVTYPSWRYHLTQAPRLVNSPADAAALGPGWYPSVVAAAAAAQ